jgi:RimJ/RimL family protein N-acetyltransferase
MTDRVQIRPARRSDTPDMLRITQDVWEGSDYIPFVWNEWLDDCSGTVQVATRDGEPVGLQHVAVLPDGSAWLEGIRVATPLRGAGIGAQLLKAGIEWAREAGCAAVRLATWSGNEASNRLAEKEGLRVRAQFARAEAVPGRSEAQARIALPTDLEAVWAWVQQAGIEFYTEGWTAHRLTWDRLRLLLALHTVAVVDGDSSIDAVAIATVSERRPALRIGLLAGSQSGTAVLASWLRARAGEAGLPALRGPLEVDETRLATLRDAGYDTEQKWWMVLRELLLEER